MRHTCRGGPRKKASRLVGKLVFYLLGMTMVCISCPGSLQASSCSPLKFGSQKRNSSQCSHSSIDALSDSRFALMKPIRPCCIFRETNRAPNVSQHSRRTHCCAHHQSPRHPNINLLPNPRSGVSSSCISRPTALGYSVRSQ